MSFMDSEITRRYSCDDCDFCIVKKQKISDDFLRICPECESDNVTMECIKSPFTIQMDLNTPQTIGALAEKNRSRMEKNMSPEEKKGFSVRTKKRKKEK